jgi:hypothetical protein
VSYTQQAEEIQRQMARIRCSLNDEVGEIVHSARVMSNWQYYVRTYPWVCAGVAVALGYLVVPHRLEVMSPDAKTLAKLAEQNRLLVRPEAEPQKRGGALGSVVSLLAGMFVRSLVGYAGQNLGRMLSMEAVKRGVGSDEPNVRRS